MFDFLNTTEKLPRGVKRILKPRKEFTKQTKTMFLAVFDVAHRGTGDGAMEANILVKRPMHAKLGVLAKVFITGAAFASIFVGVSVYADASNVTASSPLYPLKRLSETVRLAIAPNQEKPQLQASFAARRAGEISKLVAIDPSSTAIANLSQDLNTDINDSLAGATAEGIEDGKLDQLCGKVLSAIATSSIALRDQLAIRPRVLIRFEDSCAVNGSNNKVVATTTIATSTATSTAAIGGQLHIRGGGILNIITGDGEGYGSASGTSASTSSAVLICAHERRRTAATPRECTVGVSIGATPAVPSTEFSSARFSARSRATYSSSSRT